MVNLAYPGLIRTPRIRPAGSCRSGPKRAISRRCAASARRSAQLLAPAERGLSLVELTEPDQCPGPTELGVRQRGPSARDRRSARARRASPRLTAAGRQAQVIFERSWLGRQPAFVRPARALEIA
jgi:hypothetical protein